MTASNAITFYGKIEKAPLNLRLYSVYGPMEDSSRLIPVLCKKTIGGELPEFGSKDISRDFIYIDDVLNAFILSAINISKKFMENL